MKYSVGLCIVLLAAFAFVNATDELTAENCKNVPSPGGCSQVLCNKDNSMISAKSCPEIKCPNGKEVSDNTKAWPSCCPTCA